MRRIIMGTCCNYMFCSLHSRRPMPICNINLFSALRYYYITIADQWMKLLVPSSTRTISQSGTQSTPTCSPKQTSQIQQQLCTRSRKCSKYVWTVWRMNGMCVLCLSQIKGERSGNPHPNEIILWHQVISIIYDVIPPDKDLYLPLAYCIR